MEILDIKEHLESEKILPILAESMYIPAKEKLNARVEKYMNNSRIIALGVSKNNNFCASLLWRTKKVMNYTDWTLLF